MNSPSRQSDLLVLDNQIANVKPFGRRPSLTYTELLFGGSGKWPQRLKADADLRSPAFAVIPRCRNRFRSGSLS